MTENIQTCSICLDDIEEEFNPYDCIHSYHMKCYEKLCNSTNNINRMSNL